LWKCYEIKFKAKSPIHIGYGAQLGIINRTRYYIPGKTIWGAVTAILARKLMGKYDDKVYGIVGKLVRENLIFSYFYPSMEETVFYPNYTTEGFGFGSGDNEKFVWAKEKFENELITSYTSTALEKSKTAEDGSLHEFELIKDGKEIVFTGYLFAKEGNVGNYFVKLEDKPFIKKANQKFSLFEAIKNIQVGGERNYGFGWLELLSKGIKQRNKSIYGSGICVDLNDNLVLKNTDYFLALAHVNTENLKLNKIKGDLEPVIGRKWDKEKGAGENISNAQICLTPGTKFKSNSEIRISNFGMWAAYSL